jgi:hypothetical protein
MIGYGFGSEGGAFNNATQLLQGAAYGLNIAAPDLWSSSQYTSNLSIFIKLISPTGQKECIKRNIVEPLMHLIAAASPITAFGVVYGYPILWQVHAHGITNFRIGAIAALTLPRGSFETTFTKALQPTIIDVRLTIVSLLNDFATQTDSTDGGVKNIYDKSNSQYLGVQNPADIHRGTFNTGPVGGRKEDSPNIVSVKL